MADKRDVRRLPALVAGIKIEPGTLGAAPGRLPSFGGRRDLTLGASGVSSKLNQNSESKPKKIYTPNLNVQRNKNKVDLNVKDGHLNSKDKRDRHKKDDFRGKKRDKANNLIQLERKIDKEEEELKLKELLRDDFMDDPGMEPDAKNAPVMLPMLSMAKIKSEIKSDVKAEPTVPNQVEVDGVKTLFDLIIFVSTVKQEKHDDAEEESRPGTEIETTKMKLPDEVEVADLLKSKEPELVFLQLPDCLPGLKPEADTGPARPSTSAPDSTSASDPSQDLISVDLDHASKGGDMINLGAIKTRMVCTPDWETMLSKAVT
ncbi:hypothetical protein C0J52_00830 [Blattella germanica]|nr:hypothetical protein C0J52_00830 [Blattella germanica]